MRSRMSSGEHVERTVGSPPDDSAALQVREASDAIALSDVDDGVGSIASVVAASFSSRCVSVFVGVFVVLKAFSRVYEQ